MTFSCLELLRVELNVAVCACASLSVTKIRAGHVDLKGVLSGATWVGVILVAGHHSKAIAGLIVDFGVAGKLRAVS